MNHFWPIGNFRKKQKIMYTTRRGRVALQHSEVEEIKTLFNNLCSDDGRVDLYWFISSQIEKIDSLGSIKNTRFHEIRQGLSRTCNINDLNQLVTWEELVSLMKDESKGNMELPIAAPPVDMSGRDDYFAILQGKQISATREINLGFFTFPSWGKKKTEYEDQLSRKLEAFSMQSKTHKADISEIVEKKIATKEPIRDVSMIEKEEELAEAEAQVTPEDFEALFDSESEIEDENESMEGSKEAYSTEAQLIGCRFTPTDENELKQLRELLRARNPDHVTTEKYNIDMTELKLSCLRPSTWLNDEIVSFYMLLLNDRDEMLCKMFPGRKSSHFFNNFFMERLVITDRAYNYKNIQRWTKKFDIFSKHKIFVPINLSNTHWTLAVVYMESHEIHYYDSMSGRGELYLNALKSWVADEALNKRQETLDMSDWKLISREPHVPQQMNGTDCGVFAIVCADFLSDDLPLEYSQQHMPFFREKIGCDILRGNLLYDPVAVRMR